MCHTPRSRMESHALGPGWAGQATLVPLHPGSQRFRSSAPFTEEMGLPGGREWPGPRGGVGAQAYVRAP